MKSEDREFLDRFISGPRFLLLGQGSWALQDGADPVLAGLSQVERMDAGLSAIRSWDSEFSRSALSRLSQNAAASEVPPSLSVAASHAWNGVYTTTIDARISRLFDADWRQVSPVVGPEPEGRSPRSTTALKIRMLFGGLHLAEDQRPPSDELSFALREQEALSMLGRLVDELITPRGVLAIEGYRANADWLGSRSLFGVLSRLQHGQAHLFSANLETIEDPFVRAAIDRGHLTPHVASLGASLASVDTATGRGGDETGTRSIRIGRNIVPLPRDVWNSIVTVARPVDQTALQPLSPASAAVRYKKFRAFMGASEGVPDWQAIVSGFAFHRDFEDELWHRISGDLEDPDVKEPLRLEGQTASGKSVALLGAAIRAAREGQCAVLHITTRSTRPQLAVIDRFALWATEHGARSTLLLWDGMADPDDYFTMHRELRSRGRKVTIVGTSYLTASDRRKVVAPGRMSASETAALSPWLADFGIDIDDSDASVIAQNPAFLGVLYRLLPDSRRKLQDGLALELRAAEAKMEQLSRESRGRRGQANSGMTAVGAALAAAGVNLPDFLPRAEGEPAGPNEIKFADRSTAERLTSLVVVAGRRGLRIPLELVLRVLGREGSESVVEVVKHFDIIRWSDDEVGDQFLGTRNALEAELLGQADLPGVQSEIAAICELLRNIKPVPGAGGVEIEFAVDLLNRLGPDAADSARYVPLYLDLVRALRDQRKMPGRTHPRLVLYEANFARKWVMWAQEHDEGDPDARLQELSEASRLLAETLVDISHPRTRLKLLVESASVLGAEAYEKTKLDAPPAELRSMAASIVSLTSEARALDPEDYYPIDVVAWVVLRLVRGDFVSADDQVALAADALASMVSLEKAQLSRGQQAKYDSRLAQVAALLGDSELEHSRLEMLAENEDPSAYFLLALKTSGLLEGKFDRHGAKAALERLRSSPVHVREDWRCARLLLDVFWLTKTGSRFLQGEREALPFSTSDWEECLATVESAIGLADFDGYRADFLRGLAFFHLGQVQQSKSIFSRLDKESGSLSRRVYTTYLASNTDGSPRVFSGQVRSVRADGSRGSVWVNEIGTELPFIPRRFNIEDLSRNDLLPDFWVGFNMRGPFGDPIRSAVGSATLT